MHPNTYLQTLWRNETKPQVFVAMSFEPRFAKRFDEVIKPSIEAEAFDGQKLTAYRVDNSLTGDSIITDIADGIAHSALFLADVSVIDEGRYAEQPIRNGNVMYEVGLALACRLPSEVLLIRDDRKKFLFDVSTIPHITIDFSDCETAIKTLRAALLDRFTETRKLFDARVMIALKGVTPHELEILECLSKIGPKEAADFSTNISGRSQLSIPTEKAISALLLKGCIDARARTEDGQGIYYGVTHFGQRVANAAENKLPKLKNNP
jgi:DNA-binding MarR family transcriptional regulator